MRGHRLASQRIVEPGEWDTRWGGRCVRPALWEVTCECGWSSEALPFLEAGQAHIDHLWPIRNAAIATVS